MNLIKFLPTQKVEQPINAIVSKNVYFLPILSPRGPKTMAPNGLTAKPAANVSKAIKNAAPGDKGEKKCSAIIEARAP